MMLNTVLLLQPSTDFSDPLDRALSPQHRQRHHGGWTGTVAPRRGGIEGDGRAHGAGGEEDGTSRQAELQTSEGVGQVVGGHGEVVTDVSHEEEASQASY